jgi:putative tricarboxylic transport membrane protein
MIISRDYKFGSALLMDPGFFPMVLGGILIVFGICIMVIGLHTGERIQVRVSLRPLIMVPLSLVLFGLAMRHTSFLPALVVLIFGSMAAGREFRFKEALLLTGLLIVLAWAVFILGLDLPYPLI